MAIEKAIEAGVDMIELDCQLTKDGHVVVFHDERLARTTGVKGFVRGKSLNQLRKLDIGGWFKKSFTGQRILTLEEVMEILGGAVDLNLELKSFPKGLLGIELKLLFILSHYDYLERTVFSSFDYRSLRRVRELAPDSRIGVLYGSGTEENPFQLAREIGAYSVHLQKEVATPNLLERARQIGLKSFVWTVNEVADMEDFLARGVDGIISDFPEKFWKVRAKRKLQ
ncbi:MAG: glycerophosphodiester phosphodiesterase [Deltaproteobacteria bacterium]|nr:glycerophosphodiester phosphodiesterase [Deltaproteobacteria bacterium]